MRDKELLAAAREVLNAKSVEYSFLSNNCHEFVLDLLRRMKERSDILWVKIRQLFPGERVALRAVQHTFFGTYVTMGVVGALTGGAAVPFLMATAGAGMWGHVVENT